MTAKLLIYADSRGQHTPRGAEPYEIFTTKLANHPDIDAKVFLCPMKWTTTIDFLDILEKYPPGAFDFVLLNTGIVDWSPRPQPSAISDLYNNQNPANLDNLSLNTREYARKVINNKKPSFDRVFTEKAMLAHLASNFDVEFEGYPTVNMYDFDMAERNLLPRLSKIDNLIFINSNRFVPGWEGDFARGRPRNITLTEKYSALFRDTLGPKKVVDLLGWSEDDIKRCTCDNIHFTRAGSDYVYEQIVNKLKLNKKITFGNSTFASGESCKMDTKFSSTHLATGQQRSDSILIIGNGPSTKNLMTFGFKNLPPGIDTFGMGAAYRYFQEVRWWPTYYAWCDAKVVHSHKTALAKLINDPAVATEKFYFSLPISEKDRFECIAHGSTGDFCLRKSIELGYRNIYFIGIEGDYVEQIPESAPLSDADYERLGFAELFPLFEHLSQDQDVAFKIFRDNLRIIKRTPDRNPNYFFDDYQKEGDVYSLPRANTHRNSWRISAEAAKKESVNIVNLSENSKIEEFRKVRWDDFKRYLLNSDPPKNIFAPYGRSIETPEPLDNAQRVSLLKEVGLGPQHKLATLIIGVRFPDGDRVRASNLLLLLDWIDYYYGDLFDVLLIEQDSESRIKMIADHFRSYVRYEFIYNPNSFNRGWGYNTAIKHFTDANVVALLDTDVLLGANFAREIIGCYFKYKAVSPYASVYYTDENEAARISISLDLSHLRSIDKITKPTTLTGGVVIMRRATFLEVVGFEQYVEYAGEDRSLDVTLLNHCAPEEIRTAPFTYVHLNHPPNRGPRSRAFTLFSHLYENFGCRHNPSLTPEDYIHETCVHVSPEKTRENSKARLPSFGDPVLYSCSRPLTINGCYADTEEHPIDSCNKEVIIETKSIAEPIFPPTFKALNTYENKELYDAPDPDTDKIASLYNKFKGKRCFIIGNGPSLNRHDLSLLKDEYVFAVNSFFYKTDETGFRPTFYVVEDTSVMNENIDRIQAYAAPYKFFPTKYRTLHPNGSNVYFFRMNRGFYEKASPNYCVPRFSTDASKILYCGQSVTYINLQLAFFMGFTEVYLIGMDFDYVIPKEHGRRGDIIISTTDDPNHFHKDYFGKGKTWKDPKLDRVALNYRQAKLSYEAVGRKIYNATIGGKLEIFERVDYTKLLVTRTVNPSKLQVQPGYNSPSGGESSKACAPTMSQSGRRGGLDTTRVRQRFASAYASFASAVRVSAPPVFRLAQMFVWVLRVVLRHKPTAGVGLLGLAVACALPFYLPSAWLWRYELWGSVAVTVVLAVSGIIIREAIRRLATANAATVANAVRVTRHASDLGIAKLGQRVATQGEEVRKLVQQLQRDSLRLSDALRKEIGRLAVEVAAASGKARAGDEELRAEIEKSLGITVGEFREKLVQTNVELKAEIENDRDSIARLRERIVASEQQIGAIRYPDAPATLVLFGHHKCASRFFRNEVFGVAAEVIGARVRKYKIKNPPFHYSMSDDLDLCNMNFNGLGDSGRDVVLFSNATAKSLARIKRATKDWKGLRIVRDPRQILVSSYFHHKGKHPSTSKSLGWIWDQLAHDKLILQELSIEEGLLYELDHITKQIIETQILCPFDDERVMTIKIEDFSKEPKTYLRKISEFLGVADIAGVDFSRTSANPESGPWQNHFTSRLRQVFKERYGQALIDLGYAEDLDW